MRKFALRTRKYAAAASIGLQNRFAQRADLISTALTFGLFVFVFIQLWSAVYATRETLAGYDRNQMIWYFVFAQLAIFASGRFFGVHSHEVRSGNLVYALGRPYGYLWFHFAQFFGAWLVETLLLALIGSLMAFWATGVGTLSAGSAFWVLLSVLIGASLSVFLQFALALTSLWVEESSAFYWIYQKLSLVLGVLMPIEFLPEPLKAAALWSPFPYQGYVPARLAVAWDSGMAAELLGRQLLWLAIAVFICVCIFRGGQRRLSLKGG